MTEERSHIAELPERIQGLDELARNLWWSWHPRARQLFKTLDRQAWKDSGHNPCLMLRDLPRSFLEAACSDEEYLREYDLVLSRFRKYLEVCECGLIKDDGRGRAIAYFSAEYGLHRSLPFYAGGLGFLAGDHLKECSDLCVPLVAVGFMYPKGYLRQRIQEDGWQDNLEEPIDRESAAITRVLDDEGRRLVVPIHLNDHPPLHVGIWKVSVGRVPLYLLDTDVEENDLWNREISARLYTGDKELRLRQGMVLGIGGTKVLRALGYEDFVVHLNEGHAAFALVERMREGIEAGMGLEEAKRKVRETTVFTTHTPVPAGNDVFPFELMDRYFKPFWKALGIDRKSFLEMGVHPDAPMEGFNMTAFSLRLAGFSNAVSKKHGEVTRKMWRNLWPDLPEDRVPIASITNGVHVATWVEPKIHLLFDKYIGLHWLEEHDDPSMWNLLERIPDEELWRTHMWLKVKLLDAIRERTRRAWVDDNMGASAVLSGGALLEPTVLTIGFARRFATYKRADLILHEMDRLKKLVNDRWRPIQIIFAGKAHPADDPGKRVLQRLVHAARDPNFGGRVAFVEDYGVQLAQYLVHGVDVWMNNPMPPLEASGTSGMKAALNGIPHLSVADGWWIEGFNGKNGWSVEHRGDGVDGDRADAEAIYEILEKNVIPMYYEVSTTGVPRRWVQTMREAIRSAASHFSSRRMVKEYITKFYAKGIENLKESAAP